MISLILMNEHAKYSCSKWNKNKLSRCYHRWRYLRLVKRHISGAEHQRKMLSYRRGNRKINTYPWPYNDMDFAAWAEEHDETTLVTDPSNCVIRHNTSYVAYKIYEVTGKWPRPLQKGQIVKAEDWPALLAKNGYTEKASEQEITLASRGFYVGIDAKTDKIIWYERFTGSKYGLVECSAYHGGTFKHDFVMLRNFTWIRIQ